MAFTLVSKDKKSFVVTKEMGVLSDLLCHMAESGVAKEGEATPIPIDQFKGKVIELLVNWMKLYCEAQKKPQPEPSSNQPPEKYPIAVWERRFFKSLDNKQMMSLTNLANYLQVSPLIDTATSYIAEKLSSKTVEDSRTYLGLKNDFTLAEERELQERLGWVDGS